MKINWKLRLQNKATLVTLITATIAFIYQILAITGTVPKISQDSITQLIMIVVNVLVTVGIVIDPTTAGASDSVQAMEYEEPKKDGE